ncbi:hypothetical protein ACGCUP_00865 [Eubacteriales bacterium KG125]
MDKINLNELINRTTDIKIGDKEIKVRDITVKQFDKMVDIEKKDDSKGQMKLIAEVLSNNEEGIKFTPDDVENLTRPAVIYLWQLFIARSIDLVEDPN